MSITWLKLDHNIITDTKLRRFSSREKWAWITLLCLASQNEDDRGFIPDDLDDVADLCDYEPQDFKYLLDKFKTKGMIDFSAGGIKVINWDKRQHTKPSDRPEATRERKAKQRAKKKAEEAKMSRDVTPHVTLGHETDTDLDLDPELDPEPQGSSFSGEKNLQNLSLSVPDLTRARPKPKTNPEPNQEPERERDFDFLDPEEEQEFRAWLTIELEPSRKGSIIAYLNSALSNNRAEWLARYRNHQEKQLDGDRRRASIEKEPPRFADLMSTRPKSSASATEIEVDRENLLRGWDSFIHRRPELIGIVRSRPELGLAVQGDRLILASELRSAESNLRRIA